MTAACDVVFKARAPAGENQCAEKSGRRAFKVALREIEPYPRDMPYFLAGRRRPADAIRLYIHTFRRR